MVAELVHPSFCAKFLEIQAFSAKKVTKYAFLAQFSNLRDVDT